MNVVNEEQADFVGHPPRKIIDSGKAVEYIRDFAASWAKEKPPTKATMIQSVHEGISVRGEELVSVLALALPCEVGVVAGVLVAGSEKAAAHRLGLSHSTAKHHLPNARSKVGLTNDGAARVGPRPASARTRGHGRNGRTGARLTGVTGRHDAAVSGPHTGTAFHAEDPGGRAARNHASTSGRTGPSEGEEMAVGTAKLSKQTYFTTDQARAVATRLGIDFGALGFDLEQFRMGLGVELEHGLRDPETDVSGNDPIVTGKIALAHLTEFPDYYTRLATLEHEATADLQKK